MVELEKDKVMEMMLNESIDLIKKLRPDENEREMQCLEDYALKLKRRRDPSLFADSLCFPTIEQVASLARFHLHYLSHEILTAIQFKNDYVNDLTPPKKEEVKMKSKIIQKKPHHKKQKNEKKAPLSSLEGADTKGLSHLFSQPHKFEAEVDFWKEQEQLKLRTTFDINDSDGEWITTGEKKKTKISNNSGKEPGKSDSEMKDSNSNKKRTRNSHQKRKSFVSVGHSDQLISENKQVYKKIEQYKNKEDTKTPAKGDIFEAKNVPSNKPKKTKNTLESNSKRPELHMVAQNFKSPENKSSNTSLETESVGCSMDLNIPQIDPSRLDNREKKLTICSSKTDEKKQAKKHSVKLNHKDHSEKGLFAFSQHDSISNNEEFLARTPQIKEDTTKRDYLDKCLRDIIGEIDAIVQTKQANYKCVYERLKFLVLKSFTGLSTLQLILYGSLATKLALGCSDMDLCVIGFKDLGRIETVNVLQTISENLRLFQWCSNLNFIPSARVPVIKFEVNPTILFESFNKEVNLSAEFKKEFLADLPIDINLPNNTEQNQDYLINVDITADFLNESGIQENAALRTTAFVMECIKNYPQFRDLCMFVKWFLANLGLNKTFTGMIGVKKAD